MQENRKVSSQLQFLTKLTFSGLKTEKGSPEPGSGSLQSDLLPLLPHRPDSIILLVFNYKIVHKSKK